MKIEKLRNNHKKEIIIGTILTIVIGVALTFKLTHSKYRVTQSIDLASGVINYKVPDFKIMAMYQQKDGSTCTDDSCYNELTGRMPSTGYVINTSKSYCNLNGNKDNNVVIENVNGKPLLSNLIKGDKCYLYFDKKTPKNVTELIASLNAKTTTPDFSKTATINEGVYSTSDGMYGGTTYYWRGKVENNYVKFAGFCWRIIRINGDKTIRMIYDGSICHANGTSTTDSLAQPTSGTTGYAYYPGYNNPSYVGWTFKTSSQRPSTTNNDGSVGGSSSAKTQLYTWYNANLSSYVTFIADGKYCNDREIGIGSWTTSTSSSFNYAAQTRLVDNKTPTFSCSNDGDVYTLKIGLITADEVAFAGGVNGTNNTSYYLYNGQAYWTMSPSSWSGYAYVFTVHSSSSLNDASVNWTNAGLRPIINLKSDITFSSGDGTQNSPYVVS